MNPTNLLLALPMVTALAMLAPPHIAGQVPSADPVVDVRTTLALLLENEDTDGDRCITDHDPFVPGTDRGDRVFWITTVDGTRVQIAGTYRLSNLLQELALLRDRGIERGAVLRKRITEPPAARISRLIREEFWDGLTRSVDEAGLVRLLDDEKTREISTRPTVYVPASDVLAASYFDGLRRKHPEWNLRIVAVPREHDPVFLAQILREPGILSLGLRAAADGTVTGIPFVVPGGRFNEMYGWDSYFIILGLLEDGKAGLARGMVENMVYEIEHYGKVLNANRSYYLTRSQPPFLTSAARACYERSARDSSARAWLRRALLAAMHEYHEVWMGENHLLANGLSRYMDAGRGVPPEVEPGHYDAVLAPFARAAGMDVRSFESAYRRGHLQVAALDTFFIHDRAMRESGHDTSYRLLGRCADLATVDLNALLYKTETDVAEIIEQVYADRFVMQDGRVERSADWRARAAVRQARVDRLLWNAEAGMYVDLDVRTGKQTGYVSATGLWPLWAGMASAEQAAMTVRHLLPLLECPGGLASTDSVSPGPITAERVQRQWDFPFGWAPHQVLAWHGLQRYGYETETRRLAYRWLFTLTLNASRFNGTVPEKLDVAARSHDVFAEYGNVGTRFDYITREGFGWTNASFQVGLGILSPGLQDALNALIPPEFITDW